MPSSHTPVRSVLLICRFLLSTIFLIGFGSSSYGESLNIYFDMTEGSWNEDGDIEFVDTEVGEGNNAWGRQHLPNADPYIQSTSGDAYTDIYIPSDQVVDPELAVVMTFEARYLTSNSAHSFASFGNDSELENAFWFGFGGNTFYAGTGTEFDINNGVPSGVNMAFQGSASIADDTRIAMRAGYDAATESLRNFQIDTNNDGSFETELLAEPIDFSGAGLLPVDWYLISWFGGQNARFDEVTLQEVDLDGDYSLDLDFDGEDANLICTGIREGNSDFDFNDDGEVDFTDLQDFLESHRSVVGDLDYNSGVEFADFLGLSGAFGSEDVLYTEGDLSCNGSVGFEDFLLLSGNFGRYAARAQSVPEPTSFGLAIILLSGLSLFRRRL